VSQQEKRRIHARQVTLIDDHAASTGIQCMAGLEKQIHAVSPQIALQSRVETGGGIVPAKVKATVGDPRHQ